MRVTKTNWRVKQRNQLAKQIVANNIKLHIVRNGRLIHAVPSLQEARKVADNIQALLDMANGDPTAERFL